MVRSVWSTLRWNLSSSKSLPQNGGRFCRSLPAWLSTRRFLGCQRLQGLATFDWTARWWRATQRLSTGTTMAISGLPGNTGSSTSSTPSRFLAQEETLDFLDTHKAYLALREGTKERLKDAYTTVHASDIKDFKDAPKAQQPGNALHNVLQRNPISGKFSLYLPMSSTGIQAANGTKIGDNTEYITSIETDSAQGVIQFRWEVGDLLIWDNTQTMHRSMGGYSDSPRLLHRVQARALYPSAGSEAC